MARRIREAGQSYGRILVVAGGFHLWGLLHPEEEAERPAIPRDSQTVYPVRYSEPAADALSGYVSGMPAPAFYRKLWERLHEEETAARAWDGVVLDTLVRCGRRLRARGETLSAYDEQCALRQARGLAARVSAETLLPVLR